MQTNRGSCGGDRLVRADEGRCESARAGCVNPGRCGSTKVRSRQERCKGGKCTRHNVLKRWKKCEQPIRPAAIFVLFLAATEAGKDKPDSTLAPTVHRVRIGLPMSTKAPTSNMQSKQTPLASSSKPYLSRIHTSLVSTVRSVRVMAETPHRTKRRQHSKSTPAQMVLLQFQSASPQSCSIR
jgi:hypothetical protein